MTPRIDRDHTAAVATRAPDGAVVLVVEDNLETNHFLCETLAPDYRMVAAFDGREGLDKALELQPDLVIADVMMPEMSGDELVREIRKRDELSATPIIVLTAKADDELRLQMLREGAQDYLTKPFAVEELRARVGNLVAQKRVRDQLRHSQERFELALRGADLAAWDWNIKTGEVVFNARWGEMRGLRPEEVKPHVDSWISGIHPDDAPRVEKALADYFQGLSPEYVTEHRVRTASGAWIWILDRGKVFARDERGQPTRMVGTELDITDRKRLEEELRVSEARAAGIVSISADAIISIDEQQRITMFNEGAEKVFGYTKAEVLGASLDILIPERFRTIHRQHVERFAAGAETARRMDHRVTAIVGLRKNGDEFPADAAISKLEVAGNLVLTVSLRDITEQKRREKAQTFLAEVGGVLGSSLDYEDTLTGVAQLAVRDLADFCIVDLVDRDGEVRRLKAASRDPSKAWVCDVLMQAPLDRSRPHLVWEVLQTKRPVLRRDVSPQFVASLAQSDEHLRALRAADPKSILAVPLLAHGKLLGTMAFVSSSSSRAYGPEDLHLAEELALRAALSVEHAQLYRAAQRAIQARDDLLGIVAHDLRNPLNTIILQASIVPLVATDEPDLGLKAASAIERAASRMNRLIQDLLDVTKMEAGRLSINQARIAVAPLLTDSVDAQQSLAASASLELVLDADRDFPEVWADRDRVLQVLENLIGNAIKFTRPGGRIVVGAAPRDGDVLYWVTDTGVGIAPDDVPHVFDRFWQAKKVRDQGGAGLGLPISKGIVEAHGGRIWVESTPERGSTFFFTIPVAGRAEAHRSQPSTPSSP